MQIYKKRHSQATPSLECQGSQGQETFLAPSAIIYIYNIYICIYI